MDDLCTNSLDSSGDVTSIYNNNNNNNNNNSKETQCASASINEETQGANEAAQQQMSLHVKQLMAEKQSLDDRNAENGNQFSLTQKLLQNELERLQNGGRPFSGGNKLPSEERRFADIIKDKPIKVTVRVLVPAKEHPKFNFVGKLLGPKGNSLKRLQEDTMTKMAILGRGSMRDKHKEEELRLSGDHKFSHLNDDLHVEVTAFAPPAEAHARIAYALAEVRRFLVPDYNDDIRQGQMREMQLLNTSTLTLSSPTEILETSSQVSPATSPAPSLMTPGGVAKPQNGRPIAYSNQQNGRGCFPLYNQQLLLHPAFRGLTPRPHELQLPNATVFRSNGSILNRLRPHPHLAATASINNNRVSPPAVKQRNHNSSILSLLAGVPRSMFVGGAECGAADNVLLCGGDGGMPGTEDDVMGSVGAAAGVFGGYENYAAAVNGNGHGYALLEGYGNGTTLMPSEPTEELTLAQEAITNSGLSAELSAARGEGAGSVKIDRARYRHDPYGRYAGIKLPL